MAESSVGFFFLTRIRTYGLQGDRHEYRVPYKKREYKIKPWPLMKMTGTDCPRPEKVINDLFH